MTDDVAIVGASGALGFGPALRLGWPALTDITGLPDGDRFPPLRTAP